MFRTIVAKLLFICKQSKPDLKTVVVYLTTRVKQLDKDDRNKLYLAIKYLLNATNLVLTLDAADTGTIR